MPPTCGGTRNAWSNMWASAHDADRNERSMTDTIPNELPVTGYFHHFPPGLAARCRCMSACATAAPVAAARTRDQRRSEPSRSRPSFRGPVRLLRPHAAGPPVRRSTPVPMPGCRHLGRRQAELAGLDGARLDGSPRRVPGGAVAGSGRRARGALHRRRGGRGPVGMAGRAGDAGDRCAGGKATLGAAVAFRRSRDRHRSARPARVR